jgi:hypothetical protein
VAALLLAILMCSGGSSAYSVLTHEEIVDLLWTDDIGPLLLKRYPGLSEDQIKEAHAFAYGGAVIQTIGKSKLSLQTAEIGNTARNYTAEWRKPNEGVKADGFLKGCWTRPSQRRMQRN